MALLKNDKLTNTPNSRNGFFLFCSFLFTEADARNAWRNLRQEFNRQLKRNENRSGDAAPDDVSNRWPYYQKMLFLQEQFTPRESSSNFTDRDNSPSPTAAELEPESPDHYKEASILNPSLSTEQVGACLLYTSRCV